MTDATLPVRLQALQLANDFDEDADTTVTRARAYLAFLEAASRRLRKPRRALPERQPARRRLRRPLRLRLQRPLRLHRLPRHRLHL